MKGWHIILAAVILAVGGVASAWIDVYGYLESSKIDCEIYDEPVEPELSPLLGA